MIQGGCHCGSIRYEASGEPITHAICHCSDCRRHAGAPMVGWSMFPTTAVKVTKGALKEYKSSESGRRYFCPNCGTGILYTNSETLPGITDIQTGTFDDPNVLPPQVHVQTAERVSWLKSIDSLPEFDRYPPQG